MISRCFLLIILSTWIFISAPGINEEDPERPCAFQREIEARVASTSKQLISSTTLYHLKTGMKMHKVYYSWIGLSICDRHYAFSNDFLEEWLETHDNQYEVHLAIDVDFSKNPIEIGEYRMGRSREEIFDDSEDDMYARMIRNVKTYTTFFYIGRNEVESVVDEKAIDKLSHVIVNRHLLYLDWYQLHEINSYVYCLSSDYGMIKVKATEEDLFMIGDRRVEPEEYFKWWNK